MTDLRRPDTPKDSYFTIYGFMRNLKLTNSEMMVYALLYSYTLGEYGTYFGSQEKIAKSLNLSVRTVARAYRRLYDLGYIIKVEADGKRGVLCTVHKATRCKKKGKDEGSVLQGAESGITEGEHEDFNASGDETDAGFIPIASDNPKYNVLEFGKEGFVHLTLAQYQELRKLVHSDVLMGYFCKLEKLLWDGRNDSIPGPRSHYKTLKKWINEDLSV